MDIVKIMSEKAKLCEKAIADYFPAADNAQKEIYRAMQYSICAGGKRLRPIITLLACEMCGGTDDMALPFAAAIEMIHTYSLIHDDLPAMDNDDLRRGKPTNHKVFGEAMAILAGDALLNKACETALSSKLDAERVLKALEIMFNASGTEGMIGGQVIDIHNEERTEAELINLHSLKTGALIRAAGLCGAVAAGATDKELTAINDYCVNLGIAFQIQDDILDVSGNVETLGKPIGSDSENDKTTYVTLFGIEKAKKLTIKYTEQAIDAIKKQFAEKAEALTLLAEYLTDRSF